MNITLKDLRRMGACEGQVDLYKQLFGESVKLTRANILRYGTRFELGWIVDKIMTKEQCADYESKRVALDADYLSKRHALYADYESKRDAVYADYLSKRVVIFADSLGL